MMKEFFLTEIFGLPIRGTRLVRQKRIPGNIPLVTAGEKNEGIAEFISNEEQRNFKNMITIDMFGNCFYRDYSYKADDNILSFDNCENPKAMLYVVTAIRQVIKKYSYSRQYRLNSYKLTKIFLPVIESSDPNHVYTVDDIDWQYMQDRIAELEQDRIAELEAYLTATGLDDYELTDEDKAVLGDKKVMKTYRLGEVFSVESVNKLSIKGKNYIMDKDIVSEDGTTPYIAAISTNNGITGYSNYSANNKGDCITLSTTADSSNTVFYQEQSFIGRQQIAGIRRIDGKIMERYVGLYLTAAIRKITRQFNYANKLTKEYLKNCDILFPVIESSDPNHTYTIDDIDFDYMEQYIRAMEKLAIADVVKYKDKVIATTKEVVTQ